jgi:hypothetical protein
MMDADGLGVIESAGSPKPRSLILRIDSYATVDTKLIGSFAKMTAFSVPTSLFTLSPYLYSSLWILYFDD